MVPNCSDFHFFVQSICAKEQHHESGLGCLVFSGTPFAKTKQTFGEAEHAFGEQVPRWKACNFHRISMILDAAYWPVDTQMNRIYLVSICVHIQLSICQGAVAGFEAREFSASHRWGMALWEPLVGVLVAPKWNDHPGPPPSSNLTWNLPEWVWKILAMACFCARSSCPKTPRYYFLRDLPKLNRT